MFKLKFKQKMKPNLLLCLTLRRKRPKSVSLLGLTSFNQMVITFLITFTSRSFLKFRCKIAVVGRSSKCPSSLYSNRINELVITVKR